MADAKSRIQIDRYSAISGEGVSVSFLDATNKHEGWKIALNGKSAWVRFDRVDFGKGNLKSVNVRSMSSTGGAIEIHLDKADGPLLAKVEIGKGSEWQVVNSKVAGAPSDAHDLIVTHNGDSAVELDWISFE